MEQIKKNITPFLWFENEAEEAANFYTEVFNNAHIKSKTRYQKEGQEYHHQPEGSIMTVSFELEGQEFVALNGGPTFKFNPSISFFVVCETEDELNALWKSLSEGGGTLMPLDKYEWSEKYGWTQDKYGVSWQISLGKIADVGQKITPCLLFVGDRLGQAQDAIRTYTTIFENSYIDGILLYGPEEKQQEGLVKHAQFSLNGYKFMVMESGLEHNFTFNEAISFVVHCEDQHEIDHYWSKLSEDGDPEAQQCGWLKDRFGISWQVVPRDLDKLLNNSEADKVKRVTAAMLQMKKMDIEKLKLA